MRLEPIDKVHERIVVVLMEMVTLRLDFDVFFDELVLGHVSENHILWVLVQNAELVGNSLGCFFSISSQLFFNFDYVFSFEEFGV